MSSVLKPRRGRGAANGKQRHKRCGGQFVRGRSVMTFSDSKDGICYVITPPRILSPLSYVRRYARGARTPFWHLDCDERIILIRPKPTR